MSSVGCGNGGTTSYICSVWCDRIGVGISENGMMAGPANAVSNAVICSPANGTVGQFDFVNASFAGIVPDNTAGTTGMSFTQSGGQTVLYFSRNVNNGNPTDAQISTTGPTNVMWAIGKTNGKAHACFDFPPLLVVYRVLSSGAFCGCSAIARGDEPVSHR